MYKTGDYVKYRHDVCKISDIKENYINNKDYYIMSPIDDNSIIMSVPIDNKDYLKDIISKEDALIFIESIPDIKPIKNIDDKLIENKYKELIKGGNREDLVKIIKTTYLRNNERIKDKKKIGEKDDAYFNLAEKYLYNELSIALNMTVDEVKNYIFSKFNK